MSDLLDISLISEPPNYAHESNNIFSFKLISLEIYPKYLKISTYFSKLMEANYRQSRSLKAFSIYFKILPEYTSFDFSLVLYFSNSLTF